MKGLIYFVTILLLTPFSQPFAIDTTIGEQRINTTTSGDQTKPKCLNLSDGKKVCSFLDSNGKIKYQRYLSTMAKTGGENSIEATTKYDIVALSSGNFAVSYYYDISLYTRVVKANNSLGTKVTCAEYI